MSENTEKEKEIKKGNRFLIGPGFGLFLMGAIYLWFWLMPWGWESFFTEPRWAHNWAYSIILLTVGASWYQKSVTSRVIATVQACMLPILATGSVNSLVMTYITIVIAAIWGIVVLVERKKEKFFFQEKLEKRTWNWLVMHSVVIAWLLIAHMGLVFLIQRAPQETTLLPLGVNVAFLANLPSELLEISTWAFDIALIIWAIIVLYEQFKLGYNFQNKPWPKWSFIWTFVTLGSGVIGLLIQYAIFH